MAEESSCLEAEARRGEEKEEGVQQDDEGKNHEIGLINNHKLLHHYYFNFF